MIDWELLRCFLAVAELGSVERAAQMLGVSHSTTTRRLQSLERSLAVNLFDRKAKTYALTEAGQRLQRQFGPIGAALERACEEWAEGAQKPLNVRLSCTDSMAQDILPVHLARFFEQHPDLPLSVSLSGEERLVDMLKREADVVLRYCEEPPEYLVGRMIKPTSGHLCASPAYLAAYGTPEKVADLPQHKAILAEGRLTRHRTNVWLAETGVEAYVRTDSYRVMRSLCRAGLGLAFLPSDAISPELVVLPIEIPFVMKGGIWLLYRPELKQHPVFGVFRDYLSQCLRADEQLF